MLKVQEFLRNGNTLQDLSIRYNISCNICEYLGVVSLTYSNLSPLNEEIVQECRGLILELHSWDVVCKSMNSFPENFEPQGQIKEVGINWANARLVEKLDGALIFIYHYKDEWRIGMRMSADASNKVSAINGVHSDLTFSELTKYTLNQMGYKWDDYTSRLNKDYCYSFELIGPETRYGVIYNERKLVLLLIVDKKTLEEVDIYTIDFPKDKPKYYKITNQNQLYNIIARFNDPLKYEGFVLLDDCGNRIKYKNAEYMYMQSKPEPNDELQTIDNLLEYVLNFSSGGDGGYSIPPPQPSEWIWS